MPGEVEADEADLLVRCGVLHPPESPWPEQVSVRLPLAPGPASGHRYDRKLPLLAVLPLAEDDEAAVVEVALVSEDVPDSEEPQGHQRGLTCGHCGLCRLCEHSVSCVAGNLTTPTGDLSVSVVFYPISDYNPLTSYNEI